MRISRDPARFRSNRLSKGASPEYGFACSLAACCWKPDAFPGSAAPVSVAFCGRGPEMGGSGCSGAGAADVSLAARPRPLTRGMGQADGKANRSFQAQLRIEVLPFVRCGKNGPRG